MVLKIVLDTNMFISGFFFHGMIKMVFDLLLENKLRMYMSPKLKAEIVKPEAFLPFLRKIELL